MAEAKPAGKGPAQAEGAKAAPAAPAPPPKPPVQVLSPRGTPRVKYLWPIPLFVLASALFLGGLALALATRPKASPTKPLGEAKALVADKRYEEAIDELNTKVRPIMDNIKPTLAQQQDYLITQARAFAGAQATLGINRPANHKVVIEDYLQAEKLGVELEPADVARLVQSQVAMGEVDAALDRIHGLSDEHSGLRTRLTKLVVEHNLALESDPSGGHGSAAVAREEQTLDLLASLSISPDLSTADRAWVLARQAELLLHAGNYDEAINKLIRRIGLMRDVPEEEQGELYLLLGKAYFMADQPENAARQLEMADELLPRGSALRAECGVMLGRLAQAQGQLDLARDRYQVVRTDFATTPAAPRALLGLAEVHAAMKDSPESVHKSFEEYAALVEMIDKALSAKKGQENQDTVELGDVNRELVLRSLMQRFTERFESGKKDDALRFVLIAETLFPEKEVPAEVLVAIARTRRELGDALMAQARASHGPDFRVEDLDPTTRAEVKQQYLWAGDYFKRHALVTAATDPGVSEKSLWLAADSYDLAGDLEEAKKAFSQYADGASDNDVRKPEAKFRLAQIFQARRDYVAAISVYRALVDARTRIEGAAEGGISSAGVWGEKSIVPLAKCMLADNDPSNDAEAVQLLLTMVDGNLLSPDAAAYRDALVELGTTYYLIGDYASAIPRLEQAVQRYPDDRRVQEIKFHLADSHRLEAEKIKKTLQQALPQSQIDELEAARVEHLRTAKKLYQEVEAAMDGRDSKKMTAAEKVYQRNSQFYAADCAFDLKDYDEAISLYDAARLRYADDPASLVAMAQIVSAYLAEGRLAEARTANERAKQLLNKFPDSVWSRPNLPMEKKHWERWLNARTQLEQAARGKE